MKIDRLLSIVIALLGRDLVSATELARRFGVTVRTIQRDIEAIDAAGIPVTAIHGPSGGYSIMETFRLDRQFLTFDDLFTITTALQGIADSLSSRSVEKTVDKIRSLTRPGGASEMDKRGQKLYVDFSALGHSPRRGGNLAVIQDAVERNRCLSLRYTNARCATTTRVVEPHTLVFTWFSWYLLAWCRTRKDFRLFRLSRVREPRLLPEVFKRRRIDVAELLRGIYVKAPAALPIVLRFRPELRVFVEDYFPFAEISEEGGGSCVARFELPEDDWLHGTILSYGDGVEVLSPPHLRKTIAEISARIAQIYE